MTLIQVKPMLTSSVRRARSDGIIFIMFSHSKNDHFALASKQPPPRENFSGDPFRGLTTLLPEYYFIPRQDSHLIYALQHCSMLFLHV